MGRNAKPAKPGMNLVQVMISKDLLDSVDAIAAQPESPLTRAAIIRLALRRFVAYAEARAWS